MRLGFSRLTATGFVLLGVLGISAMPAHAATYESYPIAQLRALDKITGKVSLLDVPVGETVQFGSLSITAHTCRKTVPEDEPESATFLEINDQRPGTTLPSRVFDGWMFASSPALSALQHPVYDVWVIDCVKSTAQIAEPASVPTATTPVAKQPTASTQGQPPETVKAKGVNPARAQ